MIRRCPSHISPCVVRQKSEIRFSIFCLARASAPNHPYATRSCRRSSSSICLPYLGASVSLLYVSLRQSNKHLVKPLTRVLSISPPSSRFAPLPIDSVFSPGSYAILSLALPSTEGRACSPSLISRSTLPDSKSYANETPLASSTQRPA